MDGQAIRHKRECMGMTQAEFGACIGVWPSTVRNWENDVKVPLPKNEERIKEIPDPEIPVVERWPWRRRFIPRKRWSIQKCLVALGVPKADVYCKCGQTAPHNPLCGTQRREKAYGELDKEEMGHWIDNLYREARVRFHPDHAPEEKRDAMEDRFKEATEAYQAAKRIIRHH